MARVYLTSNNADLKSALNDAVNSLLSKEKREGDGFDFGFVVGFVKGALNAQWYFDYIEKNSSNYKDYLVNQAILDYLRFNKRAEINIRSLFEVLSKDDAVLKNENVGKAYFQADDNRLNKGFGDVPENKSSVIQYLENRKKELIVKTFQSKFPNYFCDIDEFFSPELIRDWIEVNNILV